MKRSSLVAPGQTVWITGGGSGIGAALAEALAEAHAGPRGEPPRGLPANAPGDPGFTVLLSGRRREPLEQTARRCAALGVPAEILPVDLTNREDRQRALQVVAARTSPVGMVVNNAGASQRAMAADTAVEVDRELLELNYLAALEITKAVLPGMIRRGDGIICTISSVAGLVPVPLRSAYNAAKAAQLAFFGTLANELHGTGVQVTTVIPGFVQTDISRNARTASGTPWGTMDPNQAGGITPQAAARKIVQGLYHRRAVVYTGLDTRLRTMLFLRRALPGVLDRILRKAEVT